ncbi:MAG: hypothetical protein GF307_14010 [candidate division Zixibacteria bacterium]|nr:hypothetical protein [candidate division Zixibacteria bacterium]
MAIQAQKINEELVKLYALKNFGEVGPKMLSSLLMNFESIDNILSAEPDELASIPRLSEDRSRKIISAGYRLKEAEEELVLIVDAGINVTGLFQNDYPEILLRLPDPPALLYYRGELPEYRHPALAVVGTTHASEDGIAVAVEIGKMLANRDIYVISGLAAGIDSSAHLGSLSNNGYTAGILGSGILNVYPRENNKLSKMMEKSGCVLSEYHPDANVSVGRLLARNRLVVGLASSVIVVELHEKSSGTMNSIIRAREQGKGCYLFDPGKQVPAELQSELGIVCFESLERMEEMIEYMLVDGESDE